MSDLLSIKNWVQKQLSLHGFSAEADGIAYLASQLGPLNLETRKKWLNIIVHNLNAQNIDSMVINREQIERSLEESIKKKNSSHDSILDIISAYEVPCLSYDLRKLKFSIDNSSRVLFPEAQSKVELYRRRYQILLKRTLNCEKFKKDCFGRNDPEKAVLKNIEWYLCSSGKIENAYAFGLIVLHAGSYFVLEDLTGSMKLNFSNCKFGNGLFVELMFVIVNGTYEDKVMHVKSLEMPPPEPWIKSSEFIGDLNTFGGPAQHSLRKSVTLLNTMKHFGNSIIFLSDIWLDNVQVLSALNLFFNGYGNNPPIAVVLMGDFLSNYNKPNAVEQLKTGFRNLSDMISKHSLLCDKTQFVFIAGPSDPGQPLIYPRGPLLDSLCKELRQKIPHLTLATNPCRIQYCTREIVVFRENILTKICRNVLTNVSSDDIPEKFAKTLISQACLAPTAPHICPVFWQYSHALDLYPLPNLIVIGDEFSPFSASFADCLVANAGSFKRSSFKFSAYLPVENIIEERIIEENF